MSPDPPPDISALPEPPAEPGPQPLLQPPPRTNAPPPESYPFWGYLDLFAFILIALFGLIVEWVATRPWIADPHVKQIFVLLPAQVLLYAFLLGALALIFRRYYGRPFWRSLHWTPADWSTPFVATCGVLVALTVAVASLLLRTPDIDSPMKALLADRTSVLLVAVLGTTLGPVFEEIVFRGFLQPLLVRSLGAAPGILLAAVPFGLLHLQEYGNSWRHALLIALAGAAFGWMRQRTGSTKAAAVMHAAYNCVFFLLLAAQQAALHGRWAEHGR
jgi:membrane protease YdiL (CAAX protease family)